MNLSRTSVGLAIRTSREVAKLTLNDLSAITGIPVTTLSRTERGERDLAFVELIALADVFKIDAIYFQQLAETFERSGAAKKSRKRDQLLDDLNEIQRLAIEAAIEVHVGG